MSTINLDLSVERRPMTWEEIAEGFAMANPGKLSLHEVWTAAVKWTEGRHGVQSSPSKTDADRGSHG